MSTEDPGDAGGDRIGVVAAAGESEGDAPAGVGAGVAEKVVALAVFLGALGSAFIRSRGAGHIRIVTTPGPI